MIHATSVILFGGSGTRLWPLSRAGFPKQFLCLSGQDSLFQHVAMRLVAKLGNIVGRLNSHLKEKIAVFKVGVNKRNSEDQRKVVQ